MQGMRLRLHAAAQRAWALPTTRSVHPHATPHMATSTKRGSPASSLCSPQTGALLLEKVVHEDAIQDMQLAPDGSYAITASLDKTAKLVDLEDFSVLKTYKTGRFVQSAAISPIFDHVRRCAGWRGFGASTLVGAWDNHVAQEQVKLRPAGCSRHGPGPKGDWQGARGS